jgi:hypothetical protein
MMRNPSSWMTAAALIALPVAALAQSGAPGSASETRAGAATTAPGAAVSAEATAEARARRAAVLSAGAKAPASERQEAEAKIAEVSRDVEGKAGAEGEAKIAARLAEEFGTTPELLIEERTTNKVGWGEIMIAHTLAASVEGAPSVADLYAMRAEGAGWGQIAAGLGISPGDALQAVRAESRVAVGLEKADGKVLPVSPRGIGVGVKPGAVAPGVRVGAGADVKVKGPKVKPGP